MESQGKRAAQQQRQQGMMDDSHSE
jgi:hypothetical protein